MLTFDEAITKLREGGVLAFPTETVYGLGANALDPKAVARVYEIKARPLSHPLIVHVKSIDEAKSLAAFTPLAERLAKAFWPGPLTLVLPKKQIVPDIVTAGMASVAIRIPSHPLALELLSRLDLPIAAPSANRFAEVSATTAEHVAKSFGDSIDGVLDGGRSVVGIESTIISLLGDKPCILRLGGVSIEDLEKEIGRVECDLNPDRPTAPGQHPKHYAPKTRLVPLSDAPNSSNIGLLTFETLSATGDLREAAANLYATLRRLDEMGLDLIAYEEFPNQGLGRAINDRLRRASF